MRGQRSQRPLSSIYICIYVYSSSNNNNNKIIIIILIIIVIIISSTYSRKA